MSHSMEFITGTSGLTLGRVGIGLTWLSAAIFHKSRRGGKWFALRVVLIAMGVLTFVAAVRYQLVGSVEGVDLGRVLGYLGIGAGLTSTGFLADSHRKLADSCMIVGFCFVVIGGLVRFQAGLL